MADSMTAFAREVYRGPEGELVWELRSVNHRYLEVHPRLPEELRMLEPQVREQLGQRLGRGKVEAVLRYRPAPGSAVELQLNRRLVEQLLRVSDEVSEMVGQVSRPQAMDLLQWPGVLEEPDRDMTPVQQKVLALLERAVTSLIETRQREGARLADIIRQRCAAMRTLVERARERMPEVIEKVRERIRNRLQEVMGELDETRVEQEIALFAQRLDVDEEMDRLATHVDEVERVLDANEPVGRRLDFLMQELNRESNTLGAKSSDVEITRIAVEMKVLIEQMREQIQNIE